MLPFVEDSFGHNDYFILVLIVIAYGVLFFLPKMFKDSRVTFLLLLFGIAWATFFDNTIGAPPFDFYDIMDGPKYTVMDLCAYFVYGPFGYLFIYFHEKYALKGKGTLFYILTWTIFAALFEWINVKNGVFTYKEGYHLTYSVPIYLTVQTILIYFYRYIKN